MFTFYPLHSQQHTRFPPFHIIAPTLLSLAYSLPALIIMYTQLLYWEAYIKAGNNILGSISLVFYATARTHWYS